MPSDIKPSCVICAWRGSCNKKFSITDPSRCPEYTLDLSIKELPGKQGVKLLIEGMPGSGKTTFIERLITRLDVRAGGFFTREIKEKGERRGFRIITVDKREGVLAHEDIKGGLRVGRYGVNLEDLENIGVASILQALKEDDLIVIDEIGAMELFSNHFKEVVEIALGSMKPLVATVSTEGPQFVDDVKHAPGVRLLTLTKDNHDALLDEAVSILKGGGI